ncbi:hypothetical protein [Streptomyces sp. NPDC005262]|uniref:hypothetical protein n=1 Tax=Streptomyces sp. NPDC005262 TaxID=3364710 RepID=UPI0036C32A70
MLVRTAYETGLRWGEISALAACHARNPRSGEYELRVTRAWKRVPGEEWYLGPPKSKAGRRTVEFTAGLWQELLDYGLATLGKDDLPALRQLRDDQPSRPQRRRGDDPSVRQLQALAAVPVNFPRPLVVPYIASWSQEQARSLVVVGPRGGIAYQDEGPYDRDADGYRWLRAPAKQGCGRPDFGRVHPLRQRRVMRRLLCQDCGGSADQDERGTLWLLEDHRAHWEGWPIGLLTTHPPVCAPCARRPLLPQPPRPVWGCTGRGIRGEWDIWSLLSAWQTVDARCRAVRRPRRAVGPRQSAGPLPLGLHRRPGRARRRAAARSMTPARGRFADRSRAGSQGPSDGTHRRFKIT